MNYLFLHSKSTEPRIPIDWLTKDMKKDKGISTLNMVIILVVIVKCVFICFALMAVCYR